MCGSQSTNQSLHLSCLCHHAYAIFLMSSSYTCLLLVGVMTSSSTNLFDKLLITWLMIADLLYGSLNFCSHLSFEGSYPGSHYLGSLKPFSIFYIHFMILSYNPSSKILLIMLPYTQFFLYLVDFREKSKCSNLDSDDLYIHLFII